MASPLVFVAEIDGFQHGPELFTPKCLDLFPQVFLHTIDQLLFKLFQTRQSLPIPDGMLGFTKGSTEGGLPETSSLDHGPCRHEHWNSESGGFTLPDSNAVGSGDAESYHSDGI